jgi:hypothetical protein
MDDHPSRFQLFPAQALTGTGARLSSVSMTLLEISPYKA